MTFAIKNLRYLFFTAILLLVVTSIRSGFLVDTSFLPRFLLLAVLLLITVLILFRKRILVRIACLEMAFFLFFLWNLLSTCWSMVPSEAIVQSMLIFVSLTIFVVIEVLYERNQRFEEIFIGFTLLAMLCSYGLVFYRMSTLEFFDPYRIISISANNNLYAGFLLISLPLTLVGYSVFRGFLKYASIAVATMAIFMIVILQSRAVYIGLLLAIFLTLFVLCFRYRFLFTRKNIVVAAISFTMLSTGVFIFYHSLDQPRRNYFLSKVPVWQYFRSYDQGVNDLLQQRQKEKATLTGIPAFDFAGSYYENANLRVIFWKKSAGLFASHPVLGVGAGNWRINVASCPEPANPDHIFKNYTYSQPHNEWIGFLTELGIPGLILASILLIFPVVIVFYRILVKGENLPVTALFYASFMAGFGLFACFDFPFKRIEHNVMYFSVLAFLMTNISMKENKTNPVRMTWKYIRIFLIAGLLFTCAVVVMRIRGEVFTLRMFFNEGKNFNNVIDYSQKAKSPFYKLTPNTLPLDWFAGVAYFRQRNPSAALSLFSEALKITPYEVRVMNDHATALYSLDQIEEAKSELTESLRIDPFFEDGRYNLAAILFFEGKSDSARILVEGCRESVKKKDFLLELY